MPEWDTEVELDETRVRLLLAAQFPALELDGLMPFAQGWDNALWVTGQGIAFRFPRRAIALAGVEREIALLPALAPRLPLPIPVPAWVGKPSDAFPWPFFGARLLPGREIADVPLDGGRVAFATVFGGFLRALHAPAVRAAVGSGLPRDPMGRADMAARIPRTRDRLRRLLEAGIWSPAPAPVAALEAILDSAAALDEPHGDVLVHGDLHVRHVLVGQTGVPSAVIDWGDVCVGDPAVDLPLYWCVLDGDGRRAFRIAYGDELLTPDRLLRARVLALFLSGALAAYAHDVENGPLLVETLTGLERTLRD